MSHPSLLAHKSTGSPAAIVFVHGFGSSGRPFGRLPEVLARAPGLEDWDIYSLSYSTGMLPDLRGLWRADPSIPVLSTYLRTQTGHEPLREYGGLALIAHSMGGLVCQRALLDDAELADRVSHLIMFGTPSNGLRKARWGRFLKQQISDMAEGGEFIGDLRWRWSRLFGAHPPFELFAIAGDEDAFVPPESSLEPFPDQCRVVVPGDHLQIVDVVSAGSMSCRVITEAMGGGEEVGGPWNSARLAVESTDFDRAVRELGGHAEELDECHLVDLALALDGCHRRDEAIAVLERHGGMHGTDAAGTLAGRHKRNWLAGGRREDGQAALSLYSSALARARAADDDDQVLYLAINVAFLEVAMEHDLEACRAAATEAIAACGRVPDGYWRAATEAEAMLYLDQPAQALARYEQALKFAPEPRQAESTHQQAINATEALGRRDLAKQITNLFGAGA